MTSNVSTTSSNQHPFRHMRLTLKLVRAQVQLLLAVEGMEWKTEDYAKFFVMSETTHKTHSSNPTYAQEIGMIGAWLRFYRKLLDRLPYGEFKTNIEMEWSKVVMGYEELLEVQPSK